MHSDDTDDEIEDVVESNDEDDDEKESLHSENSDNEDDGLPEVNVWEDMADDSDTDILEAYKQKVIYCRNMERDPVHISVMATLQRAQEEEGMDFNEALNYAVDKRKFLIQEQTKDEQEEIETDSNL